MSEVDVSTIKGGITMSNTFSFSSSYFDFTAELRAAEDEVKWADERREASSLLKEFSIPDVSLRNKKNTKSRVY